MISDVLFDALEDLRNYTEDAYWQSVYGEATIAETRAVMDAMDALRAKLDTPPTAEELSERRCVFTGCTKPSIFGKHHCEDHLPMAEYWKRVAMEPPQ